MDLHIYRNSQDRWYDLRSAARERGAVLAVNAVTLDEFVQRLTPEAKTASAGQRLVLMQRAMGDAGIKPAPTSMPVAAGFMPASPVPELVRYCFDAIPELKGARVRSFELQAAGAPLLANVLDQYDDQLRGNNLIDPQDRRWLAATRVAEGGVEWLKKFDQVVLHALYDLNEAEFTLLRALIETLPGGGTVMLFNTTANVKPTQFAEWTWQRFVREESLADKAFPEFCRPSHPHRELLERLFVFDDHPGALRALPLLNQEGSCEPWLRIVQAPGRYREIEVIGSDIADRLAAGASANEVALVVRHIEGYGELIEDVFSRYSIPHSFETGVPLLRVPFIKYWLALLDLVTSERSRDALSRVMGSAYYEPRLSPRFDVEQALAACGYLDRNHIRASILAARKNLPLTAELERFEQRLDKLEQSERTVAGFMNELQPSAAWSERDAGGWKSLMEELQSAGSIAGKMTFAEFRRIASEVASVKTVDRLTGGNAIAPGLPRVRIVHPHSLGYREYRWIFAPGLADGEFPARASANPLLPDETIEAINQRIRPRRLMTSRDKNRREPLYLFMMLDSARDRVTLTFSGRTLEGEQVYPSIYIGEIERHYATSPVERIGRELPAREAGEYLRKIADEWRNHTIPDSRASELLGPDIVRRAGLERRGIARADIGKSVLSTDVVWNPSELNSLSVCPFVFLARHRLRLRAREIPDFEVPASEVGILAHAILREFYSQLIPSDAGEARRRMNEMIARRLSAVDVNGQGPYSVFDPALWKIRRRQLVSALLEYVDFAVRDRVAGFETQPEYLDAPLPQAKLGSTMLSGKPDHVAVHRSGNRIDGIRIDDFKYSAASSSTSKRLRQSFQIPVYAYLAREALAPDPRVQIEGRYLLLRSPSNPVVSHPIDEVVFDDIRARIEELLKKVSQGALHPDPADKQDCPNCDYRRLCRFHGQ